MIFFQHLLIIYINQLELLLAIHKDVDTVVMAQTLHQSHQDLVSYHLHQSKSLLRSSSLSNTLYVLGTTSIFLCKSMIFMTIECSSLISRKQNISKHDVIYKIKEQMYNLFKNVHQRRKKGFNVTCSIPVGYTTNTLGLRLLKVNIISRIVLEYICFIYI